MALIAELAKFLTEIVSLFSDFGGIFRAGINQRDLNFKRNKSGFRTVPLGVPTITARSRDIITNVEDKNR